MESDYFKVLTRLTRYTIAINIQGTYDVQLSISKHHLLIQLWDDEKNIMHVEEVVNDLDKIDESLLVEKINSICEKIGIYRINK